MARKRATRRQGLPDKVKEALKKTPGISPEKLYRIAFKIGKKFVRLVRWNSCIGASSAAMSRNASA
jgi:hypothetical protein